VSERASERWTAKLTSPKALNLMGFPGREWRGIWTSKSFITTLSSSLVLISAGAKVTRNGLRTTLSSREARRVF
jgi:hypothetical protein